MADLIRAVIIPDTHTPLHDEAAFRCVLKAIEIVKPNILIHIGDLGEFEGASHWQWRKKRRPPLEYQLEVIDRDIKAANLMLDRIDAVADKIGCKRKHFMQGNHDEWLDRIVEENPYLERTTHEYGKGYLFKDSMSFKRRGWKYYKLGELLKIGHIRFYHGYSFAGVHHARNHLLKMGCNLMYGDKHDIQSASITHADGQKEAMCIGCLKSLKPEHNRWLKGAPHNWCHAFAIVEWIGQNFSATIHRITNGVVPIWGELIDGTRE